MGSKLAASDIPMLRRLREAHLQLIESANRFKREESDVGMLMAYAQVLDQLHDTSQKIGRDLSRLERSPV